MNQRLFFLFTPKANHRALVYSFPHFPPFQGKNHIAGARKESRSFQPASATFAVIKPYKLLRHLATAIRAYMRGGTHHSSMSMPNFSATSSGESPASFAFVSTARIEIGWRSFCFWASKLSISVFFFAIFSSIKAIRSSLLFAAIMEVSFEIVFSIILCKIHRVNTNIKCNTSTSVEFWRIPKFHLLIKGFLIQNSQRRKSMTGIETRTDNLF